MAVTFNDLWQAHPANNGIPSPCTNATGAPNFENQCAIKLGLSLQRAGVDMSSYQKAKCCWFGHAEKHVLRAEELAAWLKSRPELFGPVERLKLTSAQAFLGRQGIVLFKNFWGPGLQGDHIDVWNGAELSDGEPNYFERSQEVWFWEVD